MSRRASAWQNMFTVIGCHRHLPLGIYLKYRSFERIVDDVTDCICLLLPGGTTACACGMGPKADARERKNA